VNLKNLTLSRLFYYQALRIVERAVLLTALVLVLSGSAHIIFLQILLFSSGWFSFRSLMALLKGRGQKNASHTFFRKFLNNAFFNLAYFYTLQVYRLVKKNLVNFGS
jgi:hypothetical protein